MSIPPDILTAIKASAKKEWPGDREMQDYFIEAETQGYTSLAETDFGPAKEFKGDILSWASEYSEQWEDRATFVEEEVASYLALQERPADVPIEVFEDLKSRAAVEHEWFSAQNDEVQGGLQRFRYVRETRAKIGPIRDLLVRMEAIIGGECYNANIQNYGSWGVWEGEGRSFRYPVTMLRDGETEKRRARFDDLQPEELITGHYRFGANELSIYRALVKVIDMLETDYGLKLQR